MPSISELIQKHEELLAEGKGTPVHPELLPPLDAPPNTIGTGIPGPVRGSYQPNQILGTDFVKANTIGGPVRSPMFPIPPNNTNNTAAAKAALNAAAKASETAATNAAVSAVKNIPVATQNSGPLTQTTIGQIKPLPVPPAPRFIPLDNVVDGVVYNRFLAVHMYNGGILPVHVNGQLASIDIGTITQIAGIGGANAVSGWQVRGSATIDIPAGLNSITFTLGGAALVASGSGSFDIGTSAGEGWGVAIFSGSAPSTPSANSNGVLTQNSTVTVTAPTAGSMNIAFYVFWTGGSHLGLLSNGALFGVHTVLPLAASAVT